MNPKLCLRGPVRQIQAALHKTSKGLESWFLTYRLVRDISESGLTAWTSDFSSIMWAQHGLSAFRRVGLPNEDQERAGMPVWGTELKVRRRFYKR